eukprot:TRINITY_DN5772_c4_g1_i1.p1 TRINITY_DN5772_c4_g1~~TRINITY_DN5772_c4_g1_i1.p1  ORF type:complete len:891 (+),score=252.30 TRINITY_DN5772_c4_g1_i1:68-2674(+)
MPSEALLALIGEQQRTLAASDEAFFRWVRHAEDQESGAARRQLARPAWGASPESLDASPVLLAAARRGEADAAAGARVQRAASAFAEVGKSAARLTTHRRRVLRHAAAKATMAHLASVRRVPEPLRAQVDAERRRLKEEAAARALRLGGPRPDSAEVAPRHDGTAPSRFCAALPPRMLERAASATPSGPRLAASPAGTPQQRAPAKGGPARLQIAGGESPALGALSSPVSPPAGCLSPGRRPASPGALRVRKKKRKAAPGKAPDQAGSPPAPAAPGGGAAAPAESPRSPGAPGGPEQHDAAGGAVGLLAAAREELAREGAAAAPPRIKGTFVGRVHARPCSAQLRREAVIPEWEMLPPGGLGALPPEEVARWPVKPIELERRRSRMKVVFDALTPLGGSLGSPRISWAVLLRELRRLYPRVLDDCVAQWRRAASEEAGTMRDDLSSGGAATPEGFAALVVALTSGVPRLPSVSSLLIHPRDFDAFAARLLAASPLPAPERRRRGKWMVSTELCERGMALAALTTWLARTNAKVSGRRDVDEGFALRATPGMISLSHREGLVLRGDLVTALTKQTAELGGDALAATLMIAEALLPQHLRPAPQDPSKGPARPAAPASPLRRRIHSVRPVRLLVLHGCRQHDPLEAVALLAAEAAVPLVTMQYDGRRQEAMRLLLRAARHGHWVLLDAALCPRGARRGAADLVFGAVDYIARAKETGSLAASFRAWVAVGDVPPQLRLRDAVAVHVPSGDIIHAADAALNELAADREQLRLKLLAAAERRAYLRSAPPGGAAAALSFAPLDPTHRKSAVEWQGAGEAHCIWLRDAPQTTLGFGGSHVRDEALALRAAGLRGAEAIPPAVAGAIAAPPPPL